MLRFTIVPFDVLEQGGKPQICDFIHGSDGLGNVFLPTPKSKKIEKTASEFLVDMVSENPGEVSILALGPLTNLALVSFNLFSSLPFIVVTLLFEPSPVSTQ